MEEIILKQLNREKLSNEERESLEKWLVDPGNVRLYNQLKLNLNGPDVDQMDQMQQEVWQMLTADLQTSSNHPSKRKRISQLLKVAAVLLLVSLSGLFVFEKSGYIQSDEVSTKMFIEKESLLGQKLTFTLPDGSSVKLNAGSKLIFPEEFDSEQREVKLVGEAFFDVKRDVKRPFRINTKDLNVEVLGTSFNISAYPEDESSVAVKSGKVSVRLFSDDTEFLLDPNEIVSYSSENNKVEKYVLTDNQRVFGWTEKKLIYNNSNINHILADLSKWYGVEFEIKRELDTTKNISGRYENPLLVDVMESLAFAYDFDFEIENNKVTIR